MGSSKRGQGSAELTAGEDTAGEASALIRQRYPRTSFFAKVTVVLSWLTLRQAVAFVSYMPRVRYPWTLVDMLAPLLIFPERGFHGELVRLPHCDGQWFTEGRKDAPRAILYLHGGGFISCGVNTHRRLATKIAKGARASVLAVGYRQLPEHYVDESVADCVLGYRWLLDRGYAPGQIAFAGDSTGAYLVFATAFRLREEGLPLPSALVGVSPFTDWAIRTKVNHPNTRVDGFLPRSVFYYVERKMEEARARATVDGEAPARIDLYEHSAAGFPPVLIHASSSEALLPDAERFAAALADAGVEVALKLWRRQPHVFQGADFIIPEARISIAEIARFIRRTAQEPRAADPDQEDDDELSRPM